MGYCGVGIWGHVPSNDPTKSTSEAKLGQINSVLFLPNYLFDIIVKRT